MSQIDGVRCLVDTVEAVEMNVVVTRVDAGQNLYFRAYWV